MFFLFIGMNILNGMDFSEVENLRFQLHSAYSPTFYLTAHHLLIALNFSSFTI